MLLRRVSEHVSEQNWLAVFIDFVIVVIGVFIGIQVANWNDERLNRREESVLIERLQVDFDRIRRDSDRSLLFHELLSANLRTMLRSLRSKTLQEEDVADFERAIFLGLGFQTSSDHAGTFTELMSSGRANILRDRDLLDALVEYEDFLERFTSTQQYFLDMVMQTLTSYSAAFKYDEDLQFSEELFDKRSGAPLPVSYDFDAMANDPAFENAVEQLLFVQSGFTLWRQRISSRVDAIQQRLSEIAPAE
jgi:hypothetical protein